MSRVLITGANRGIGREVAAQLADRGHGLVLACRDPKAGDEAAKSLPGARALVLDLTDLASIDLILAGLDEPIDILINNAGVYPSGGLLDVAEERLDESLAVNFLAPLRLCRALMPGMNRRGFGRIVNVSSGAGSFDDGLGGPGAYALAKAALNALTLRLSREARGDVKVNAVCPGWVRTRMGGSGAPRSVETGAETVVWLAELPADGPSGLFFRDKAPIPW